MGQNNGDSAVGDGATTPAETPGAAETPANEPVQTSTQTDTRDPWAAMVENAGSDGPVATEPVEKAAEKPAETADGDGKSKEEPKEAEKVADDSEDPEQAILKELFDEDKPAEEAKEPKSETEESEDDKLDKQDPEEMAKGQRNATSAAYLKRQEKFSVPLKALRSGEIEPLEALKRLEPVLGPDKVRDLRQAAAHELVDSQPDATFKRAYAIKMLQKDPNWDANTAPIPSLDDIIVGRATTEAAKGPEVDLSTLTAPLDGLGIDWRDPAKDDELYDEREMTMVATARALESKAKEAEAARVAAEAKLSELTASKEQETQTEAQREMQGKLMTKIGSIRSDIQTKFLPYAFKNSGLALADDDTPEVAAFKQRRQELYEGTEYERANNYPSRFESFLENESSVKSQYEEVATRVTKALADLVEAEVKGDKAAIQAAESAVADERVPMFTLMTAAHREFAGKYVTPELKLLVDSSGKAKAAPKSPRTPARTEVTSSGGTARPQTTPKTFRTANDVWNDLEETAIEEDRLAAAG